MNIGTIVNRLDSGNRCCIWDVLVWIINTAMRSTDVFLEREVTFVNFHVSFIACVVITYFIAMLSYKCVYIPANKINKWLLSKMK